jgi:DNA-binding Lrp family transcriptional regulator
MIPNDAGAGGVWVTCADLARRRNVSRAAISKRVKKLEADGLIATRTNGASKEVELASFDRAIGETGDAVKEQAAETRRTRQADKPSSGGSGPMRDAQTERAQYEARLKALDLAERQGQILPIRGEHGIEAAAVAIGIAIARDADGLIRYADEIATAVSKEGTAGARRVLKQIGTRFREQVAASLGEIAARGTAAERAGPIETEVE